MTAADLTRPQFGTLAAISAMRADGHTGEGLDMRSVRALERRELVVRRSSPALSRVEKWFATPEGHGIVYDDRMRGASLKGIVPSKPDLWRGTPVDRSRFTAEQVLELDRRRKDHRFVRSVVVIRGEARHACPVVGHCRDGRLGILSPSGAFTTANPDGSLPRGRNAPAPYGRGAWT